MLMYLIKSLNLACFFFGATVFGMAIHSSLTASWFTCDNSVKEKTDNNTSTEMNLSLEHPGIMPTEFCEIHNVLQKYGLTRPDDNDKLLCSIIATEKFFLVITSVNFGASLFRLVLVYYVQDRVGMYNWLVFDMGYHGVFSLLYLAAGMVHIEFAAKTETIAKWMDGKDEFHSKRRTEEKITSGAVAVFEAVLCILTIGLIGYHLRTVKSPTSSAVSLETIY